LVAGLANVALDHAVGVDWTESIGWVRTLI
jgi:hypothetical protein